MIGLSDGDTIAVISGSFAFAVAIIAALSGFFSRRADKQDIQASELAKCKSDLDTARNAIIDAKIRAEADLDAALYWGDGLWAVIGSLPLAAQNAAWREITRRGLVRPRK